MNFEISSLNGYWEKSISQNNHNIQGKWVELGVITATGGTGVKVKFSGEAGKENYATAIYIKETQDKADAITPELPSGTEEVAVLVNQIGYDTDKTKLATIPNVSNGTKFTVNKGTEVVFEGTVQNNVADFTVYQPNEVGVEYRVLCEDKQSNLFKIENNLIYRTTAKGLLDFMAYSRQDKFDLGHKSGYAWRDTHHFGHEMDSLVKMYMSNPYFYENLPMDIVNYTSEGSYV